MSRFVPAAVSLTVTAGLGLTLGTSPSVARAASDGPAQLSVGSTNTMYPAFTPGTTRYAVHRDASGALTVAVGKADRVWFNGVPSPSGATTLRDLSPGDEVSVFITDEGVRRTYALFVLPDLFPTLQGTTTGAVQPGHIALTLTDWGGTTFETIVDRSGVPVHARPGQGGTLDLKQAPNGSLTVQRPTNTPGRTGSVIVELDDRLEEVGRHETVGLVNTDNHDAQLMPDGSMWLIAYERNQDTGLIDSVIQHVSAAGEVLFEWSTAPYADETVIPPGAEVAGLVGDYAHINSIDIQADGDVVASFRHLNSVWRIATTAHDGHQPGDVVWKLGGRDSTFSFAPGEGGPCAQHTATVLPNGNVMTFDNGGSAFFKVQCMNPDDPQGPLVDRPSSRVVEWALDEAAGTASVARTYGPTDRFSGFAGGAFRLDNGNILMAWTPDLTSIADEVSASDEHVWTLVDQAPKSSRLSTYRAQLVPARDAISPVVTVSGPGDGVAVTQGSRVPASFSCTDRGGSTLQTCAGPVGEALDTTTVGTHTWTVTATDGAGNTDEVTRTYTVTPALVATPDVLVKLPGSTRWHGAGVLLPTAQQAATSLPRVGRSKTVRMRVVNRGTAPGRILVTAPSKRARGAVRVSYRALGSDRTKAVANAGWRTPRLQPGETVTIRVRITVVRRPGVKQARLPLRASTATARDAVTVVLRRR
ncbi:MAG: aryl-sulfate sulfotransferase [Nocardioides sp.]|nr:aryl-sulfate sulfotransferase [Nocardioides sp.]